MTYTLIVDCKPAGRKVEIKIGYEESDDNSLDLSAKIQLSPDLAQEFGMDLIRAAAEVEMRQVETTEPHPGAALVGHAHRLRDEARERHPNGQFQWQMTKRVWWALWDFHSRFGQALASPSYGDQFMGIPLIVDSEIPDPGIRLVIVKE